MKKLDKKNKALLLEALEQRISEIANEHPSSNSEQMEAALANFGKDIALYEVYRLVGGKKPFPDIVEIRWPEGASYLGGSDDVA